MIFVTVGIISICAVFCIGLIWAAIHFVRNDLQEKRRADYAFDESMARFENAMRDLADNFPGGPAC